MLEYRKEMYSSVEDKFLIDGHKYGVYVNGDKEINQLIMYLGYDFVKHESMKNPGKIEIQDSEFIVSCYNKLSLVANYPSNHFLSRMLEGLDFKSMADNALPLLVFMDKDPAENHPEYFI